MAVVDRAPVPLLVNAHELAIALVILALGLPALFNWLPGQGSAGIPQWAWRTWGGTMTVACIATWVGLFLPRPRSEWVGQVLAGWGLSLFAFRLAFLGLEMTWPTVAVFQILAVVSWWRAWKITSVSFIQHRLTRAAREAHQRVHGNGRNRAA